MVSLRDHGFINYYGQLLCVCESVTHLSGMQRFGTSSVATHTIGLALLQSRWQDAIDLILSLRKGEHPDCTNARLVWQNEKDAKKALELMPRRSVAERCIWEFYASGKDLTDRVGALATVGILP
jgi:tRNA pseudouridine13 synthase